MIKTGRIGVAKGPSGTLLVPSTPVANSAARPAPVAIVGSRTSKTTVGEINGGMIIETAAGAFGAGLGQGLPSGASVTATVSPSMLLPVLDGFLPPTNREHHMMYREMYHYDTVCGSAIDLLSTFPFGDFDLSGMDDEKRARVYASSVEKMKIRSLMPALSTDYLTLGLFIGTLNWNEDSKIYDAINPQNVDFIDIQPLPIHGHMPVLRMTLPPELLKLIDSGKPEYARFRKLIPDEFRKNQGSVVLDPESCIYIARNRRTADYAGVSLLRRCLPVWLAEKALIRGTIDQFWRRQRAILHVTPVISDDFKPVEADYRALVDLLVNADADPTGPVLATRDININEIRRGDDFLKWPDFYDAAQKIKLQAMGLSESLWTSDASVAVAEGAVSVSMQGFKQYRDSVTQDLFYSKIFPRIAVENEFFQKQQIVLASADGRRMHVDRSRLYEDMGGTWTAEFSSAASHESFNVDEHDLGKYSMPKVVWHTSLDPTTSLGERMEALKVLSEQGMPIPLRMYASAYGLRLEDIASQRDSDISIREFMAPWRDAIAKLNAPHEDEGSPEKASLLLPTAMPGTSVGPRVGLLNRRFPQEFSAGLIERGGKMVVPSRAERLRANERINKTLIEASTNVLTADLRASNAKFVENARRKHYTPPRKKGG